MDNRGPLPRRPIISMESPYFRRTGNQRQRASEAEKKGKEREGEGIGEIFSSEASSETVLTKTEKPCKALGRWRYAMEVPEEGDGDAAERLWEFVGAHAEDKHRKKPCFLAQKAWKLLVSKSMAGYRTRGRGEVGGLPVAMPGRLASWRRSGKKGDIKWSQK